VLLLREMNVVIAILAQMSALLAEAATVKIPTSVAASDNLSAQSILLHHHRTH